MSAFVTDLGNRMEIAIDSPEGWEIRIVGKQPLSQREQALALADLIENTPVFDSIGPHGKRVA